MRATFIALRNRHRAIRAGMQEKLSYSVMGKPMPVLN